jgi:uncharacterized protein YciI
MKNFKLLPLFLFAIALLSFPALAQEKPAAKKNPKYDKELAARLGGNKNGMKQYVFATLKRGAKKFEDAARQTLLKGHMEFINRMAKEGKLVLAGPFGDQLDVRGIFIFDVRTVEEAQKMVEADPSIKAGLFEVELRPWFGTAALMEVLKIHEKITEEEM